VQTKPKPKTNNYTVSDAVMMKAHEMFEPFKYGLPEDLRDTRQYCYVKTNLGYLEIDIRSLLYLTARLITPHEVTEITEAVLETALRAIQRLPDYLMHDLVGIGYEEFLRERLDLELHRRKNDDNLHGNKEKSIHLFEMLLSNVGPGLLQIDAFRDEFIRLFSGDGYIGKKTWKIFVESKIRVKKRRGRPRKSEYDLIYQQRKEDAQESYGKLLRKISSSESVSHAVLLNRAKAAVAYRKRKNL
jgi:phage protein U